MTGAAHALIIIIIHTTFPFLSLSPGPDLHLPTSGQKQPLTHLLASVFCMIMR